MATYNPWQNYGQFEPTQLDQSPIGGFSFAGLGTLPTGLSAGTGIPESVGISSEAPIGNQSAQNTAQKGKDGSNALMEAWKGIQAMYEPTGGMPFAGSEDIRVKRDVYGRPYTTVRVSPTEHRGLGGELIKDQPEQGFGLRPGIAGTSTAWKGPHSWEEGSDYTRDVRNATNAAAATEIPKIKAEQEARAAKLKAMRIDPFTRESI
jgi:hypothetical protein